MTDPRLRPYDENLLRQSFDVAAGRATPATIPSARCSPTATGGS